MLQTRFTWHGGPVLRALDRAEHRKLFDLMRNCGRLELAPPRHEAYSYLHNVSGDTAIDLSQGSWHSWVEQKQRTRVMYLVFLLDATYNVRFKRPPQFAPSDTKLPLQCDDAACEARQPDDCARALGFHGREAQTAVNVTGGLRTN